MQTSDPKGTQKMHVFFRGNPSNLPYMFASSVVFSIKKRSRGPNCPFFSSNQFHQTRVLPICLVGTRGTKHACILRNEFLMYRDFTITICLEPTQRLVIAGAFVRAFWKLELFTFASDILTLIKMMYAHISRKGHHILISYTIENTFNWRR